MLDFPEHTEVLEFPRAPNPVLCSRNSFIANSKNVLTDSCVFLLILEKYCKYCLFFTDSGRLVEGDVMECLLCSDGSDIMQTVIQIKSIPALCFHVLASHYVFHNFSQSTQQLQNSSTDSELPAYRPPPTTTSHSDSPSSPHPRRKVQSAPCVRAQRPE